jgi:hypothetical protein
MPIYEEADEREKERIRRKAALLAGKKLSDLDRPPYVPKPIQEARYSESDLQSAARQVESEVHPSKTKLSVMKTSDPDYYAESLLYEMRQTQKSVLECFDDLKKHMIVIEKMLMTINRRVKKWKTTS